MMIWRLHRLAIGGIAIAAALALAACDQEPYPTPTAEAPPPPPPPAELAGAPTPPPAPLPPPPPPAPRAPVIIAMAPIPNPPEHPGRRHYVVRRVHHGQTVYRYVAPVQRRARAIAHAVAGAVSHAAAPARHPVAVRPAPHVVAAAPVKPLVHAPAKVAAAPKAAAPAKPAAKAPAPATAATAAGAGAAASAANTTAAGDNAQGPLSDRATRLAALETALADAVKKTAELKVPQSFTAGKPADVTLTIPADFSDTLKDESAKDDLSDAAASVNLTAVLSGDGFAVTPDTAQSQPLTPGQPTEFHWSVTAQDGAKGPLHADVGADLLGAGSDVLNLGTVTAGDAFSGLFKSNRMLGIGILVVLAVLVLAWLARGRGGPSRSAASRREARRARSSQPVVLGGDEI